VQVGRGREHLRHADLLPDALKKQTRAHFENVSDVVAMPMAVEDVEDASCYRMHAPVQYQHRFETACGSSA
jgi:hypothetical protein